jgi:hypothetical protein
MGDYDIPTCQYDELGPVEESGITNGSAVGQIIVGHSNCLHELSDLGQFDERCPGVRSNSFNEPFVTGSDPELVEYSDHPLRYLTCDTEVSDSPLHRVEPLACMMSKNRYGDNDMPLLGPLARLFRKDAAPSVPLGGE